MKHNKKMRKAVAAGLASVTKSCKCIACNGSGYYDTNGSPKCSSCKGTGKETK